MGWLMMAPPGSEAGPCAEPCEHRDCAATRKQAETPCIHCGEPIGYETKFYFLTPGDAPEQKMAHALCDWQASEREQKTA